MPGIPKSILLATFASEEVNGVAIENGLRNGLGLREPQDERVEGVSGIDGVRGQTYNSSREVLDGPRARGRRTRLRRLR